MIDGARCLTDRAGMGGIASAAMSIASTVSAGGPATVEPPAIMPTAVVATPSTARPYLIIDLPRSRAGAGMNAAVAQAVRLDGEPVPVDVASAPDPADVEADVIAAHEGRITAIRQRIATLRGQPSRASAPQLADLAGRLRKAEAARSLAVSRRDVAATTCVKADCAPRLAALPPRPPTVAKVAAASAPNNLLSAPVRQSAAAPRQPVPPQDASPRVAMAVRTPAPLLANGVETQSRSSRADPPRAGWTSPQPGGTDKLAEARALLAKARAALQADAPDARAPVQLAGLWQWEGSDRWSLSAGPTRTA